MIIMKDKVVVDQGKPCLRIKPGPTDERLDRLCADRVLKVEDLEFTTSSDITERMFISYESADEQIQLVQALERRARLRKLIAATMRQLRKERPAVVARHTTYVQRNVIDWEAKPIIVKRHKAITIKSYRWVSKLEYIQLRIADARNLKTLPALQGARQYLLEHPDKDVPRYKRIAYIDGYYYVTLPIGAPGGSFLRYPEKGVTYVKRDWKAIENEWTQLKSSRFASLQRYYDSLKKVNQTIADAQRRNEDHSMEQFCFATVLPEPPAVRQWSSTGRTFAGLPVPLYQAPRLRRGSGHYADIAGHTWRLIPWDEKASAGLVDDGLRAMLSDPQDFGSGEPETSYMPFPCDPALPGGYQGQGYLVQGDITTHVEPLSTPSASCECDAVEAPDSNIPIIDLDQDEPDIDNRADEAMKLNASRVLNADGAANRDAVKFVLFRSGMELQDVPATVQTGKQFLEWVKSLRGERVHARFYYVKRSLGRKSVFLLAKPVRGRFRTLHILRSTPRQLASLYLAWKFGVKPTLDDAQVVAKEGITYLLTCRRWLNAMHLNLMARLNQLATISRGWYVASGVVPRSAKYRTYQERIDATGIVARIDRFKPKFHASSYEEIEGFHIYPLISESTSKQLYLPSLVCTPDAYSATEQFCRAHNERVLRELYPCSDCICVRQALRGRFWARFAPDRLLKALTNSVGNLVEQLRIVHTTWELTPLSFVVDWFTNTNQMWQQIQNLLSRSASRLFPSGRPWVNQAHDVWVGVIPLRNPHLTMRWESGPFAGSVIAERCAITSEQPPVQATAFGRTANVGGATLVCEYTARRPIYVEMHKSTIRACHRRESMNHESGIKPRFRVNLTMGKVGSLLAMLFSGR